MANELARKYLDELLRINRSVGSKVEQIERIRSRAEKVTQTFNDMPTASAGAPDKFLNMMVQIESIDAELVKEYNHLVELEVEARTKIGLVSDSDERVVLEYRYLCGMEWQEIFKKMHRSDSWVYKKHGRALFSFEKIINPKEYSKIQLRTC